MEGKGEKEHNSHSIVMNFAEYGMGWIDDGRHGTPPIEEVFPYSHITQNLGEVRQQDVGGGRVLQVGV